MRKFGEHKFLQLLCLDVIVENFEHYYLAYSKSDDTSLLRKFEFLQRVYSCELVSQLSELEKMQTKYINFLINKYLRILDTSWFENCSWEIISAKFVEIGANLQKIIFYNCEERPWKNIFPYLSSLEVMIFSWNCNDEILKCISQFCPNIVEVDVTNCSNVTDEGIKSLCMKENGKPLCPKLKKVFILNTDVSEEAVQYLIKNLRSLEETDYIDLPQVLYSLHENDLSILDKIEPYKLTSLDLLHFYSVPHYTNLLKVCLSLCPFLKSFSCIISNTDQLSLFSNPSEIEKLHIDCLSNSEINITNILKFKGKKLRCLTVTHCALSVYRLSESCPHLKELRLIRVNFQNDDDITPVFRCLETCIFEFESYTSTIAISVSSLLKHSPKLEYIGFKYCDLHSSELKTDILRCCENCSIKKVNFSGSSVEIEFVKDILLNCHSLQSLKLDDCGFETDEELELYEVAGVLPNNPEIFFNEQLSFSDDEDDDLLNSVYDFDDDDYDVYDDYDDYDTYDGFYHDYDDDDDDDDYFVL